MVCTFGHRDSWAWWRIWTRNRGEWWCVYIRLPYSLKATATWKSSDLLLFLFNHLWKSFPFIFLTLYLKLCNVYHFSPLPSLRVEFLSFTISSLSIFSTSAEHLFSDLKTTIGSLWLLIAESWVQTARCHVSTFVAKSSLVSLMFKLLPVF